MTVVYVFLILIIFGGSLGLLYAIYYNKLHEQKIKVDEAEGSIDEALRKRYDLLIRFGELLGNRIRMKSSYFKELVELKETNFSNFELDRKLIEGMNLIYKLKSDYPELEKERSFKELIIELKDNEEKLEAGKSFYNKYTTLLNEIIKKFPSNIVARIHRFDAKPYFDGKDLEDNIIDDFKL